MHKKFIFSALLVIAVLVGCAAQESAPPEPDVRTPAPPTEADTPKTYSGSMTLDLNFGQRSGTYDGEINADGLPDGHGVFRSVNTTGHAWSYDGDWVDGHWNGFGISEWDDGSRYEGEFLQDLEDGNGIYRNASGVRYEGVFSAGAITGEGIFYWPDGGTFSAVSASDNALEGIYTSPDGSEQAAQLIDGEIVLLPAEPADDFFNDERRQEAYRTLYRSYRYDELKQLVEEYLSSAETGETDNAWKILALIEPAMAYQSSWEITHDNFDNTYILTFAGGNALSGSRSVCVSVDGTSLDIKVGFRKSKWLFFDRIELSIDGERAYSASVKSYDTTRTVISGGTIEEYCYCSFYDSVLEKLKNADTVILRFENASSRETYDHTLSAAERDSLYCGYLLRCNNKELSNLLYRYNNSKNP